MRRSPRLGGAPSFKADPFRQDVTEQASFLSTNLPQQCTGMTPSADG